MPLVDLVKHRNSTPYLLEKELQHDLMQFVGAKNDSVTQLRIAQIIKYHHTRAKVMGWNEEGNMANIYSSSATSNNIIYDGTTAAASGNFVTTNGVGTATTYSSASTNIWDGTATSGTGELETWYDHNTISHTYKVGGIEVKFGSEYLANPDSNGLLVMKTQIRNNLAVNIKSRANVINNVPKNEQVAIETLRETITETEFRKYIKFGFVLVKGKSGATYQVFRNKWHTRVWKNGKVIEEVCVRIKNSKVPPTDNVIAFKTIIETDEQEFKKLGNVYKMSNVA